MDFEIAFCEDLLGDKPDLIEALVLLGEAYTKRGLYRKGLDIDKTLVRLKPKDPVAIYNLACSFSLLGKVRSSLRALEAAIKKGYTDMDFMKKDPDLENARRDKHFMKILKKLDNKKGGDRNGVWYIKEAEERQKGKKEKGYEEKSSKEI